MRKKNHCVLNLKEGKAIRRRDTKQTQTDDQTHWTGKTTNTKMQETFTISMIAVSYEIDEQCGAAHIVLFV